MTNRSLILGTDCEQTFFDFETTLCTRVIRSLFGIPGQLTGYVLDVECLTVSLEDPHWDGWIL